MSEKKKERDWGDLANLGLVGSFVLVLVGGLVWETAGKYMHGATPNDLENVSLVGSPKQLGRALPATDVDKNSVRVSFRAPAGKPYRFADFRWDSGDLSAPTSMRIVPEHADHDEHGAEVLTAFTRRFHAAHAGQWRWGHVELNVHKDGEVSFRVDDKSNPLFDRQLEASRQILLEAAFGIPVRVTDQELAEVLGTGYPTADVGKIDPRTPIEQASAAVTSRFPGSLQDQSARWEIAVDHPLLRSITLEWSNQRGGMVREVHLSESGAYEASRDLLQACLATKLGPPRDDVTDYAAGKKNYVFAYGGAVLALKPRNLELRKWDETTWARTFEALASCKDTAENTGSRGDLKKK